MNVTRNNQEGFTLVEILVALTIFAIGLLAIAGLQVDAIRYNASANFRTNTVAVVQGVLEEIAAMDGNDASFSVSSADQNWTRSTLPSGYSATWSVTANTPVSDIATVAVTVVGPWGQALPLTDYKHTY